MSGFDQDLRVRVVGRVIKKADKAATEVEDGDELGSVSDSR